MVLFSFDFEDNPPCQIHKRVPCHRTRSLSRALRALFLLEIVFVYFECNLSSYKRNPKQLHPAIGLKYCGLRLGNENSITQLHVHITKSRTYFKHLPESMHCCAPVRIDAAYLAILDYLRPAHGHFDLCTCGVSEYWTEVWHAGSGASWETARLTKGSSDRWNLNLKLMRRVWWPAVLSLLMKAEGNRSAHGPNRCSLICFPNTCYGVGALMTLKQAERGNHFYLSVREISVKANGFVLKGI